MQNPYQDNNFQYFEELRQLKESNKCYANVLLHSKKYILDWINEQLKDKLVPIDFSYNIATKVYWILNGLTDFPICPTCKEKQGFFFKQAPYHEYCCKKCAITSEKVKQKTIASLKETFKNNNQIIIAKRKQTLLRKYGNENFINTEKAQQTFLQKYGVTNPNKLKSVKEKIKNTREKKYGDKNFTNRNKARQTCLEKYGVENVSQLEAIKQKKQETTLKHFGVKIPSQSNVVKEKMKNTCLERYGVDNIFKHDSVKGKGGFEKIKMSYEKIILASKFERPLFSFDDYLKRVDDNEKLKFKCLKCGKEFSTRHHDGTHKHCPICYPTIKEFASQQEKELFDFVSSLKSNTFERNCRSVISPFELDIYSEQLKLAIEFDGLYWHSEEEKPDKNYHLNKTLACEKQGIQLIHIFENEWLTKQEIVKSRLKNLLGVYDKTIYARKCIIKEVDSKISKEFQDENHIQGSVNSKVNLGLFFNDELISLMTFGKCRFDKKHEWELLRFCNKLGYHIPGAASKLLSYFEENYKPTSLVSYADRRWSQGKVYEKLGFTFSHASLPNYWYWKNPELLESRIKYQKHKLKDLLENFDKNKTEVENMKANNYNRIFDCGNLVYEKFLKNK